MKTMFQTIAVAFSMYSRIPMPQVTWNEKNMRFSLLVFPLVGAVAAAAIYLLFGIFSRFSLSPAFFSAAAVFSVVLITGGIHLDGYCDTVDALSSNKTQEEKLRILKDPHTGAFAVIYTAALLILQFGAWYQVFLTPDYLFMVLIAFILSRTLASLALVTFPCARATGLAAAFAENAAKNKIKYSLICCLILCLAAMFYQHALAALLTVILIACSYLWFLFMARREFGGLTGDLAGFYIVFCETLVLVGASILGGVSV